MLLPAFSPKTKFMVGDKIFVENVRATMGVSNFTARLLCNMAVIDGSFVRWYGVECPVCSRIIARYSPNEEIPATHVCDICEQDQREFQFLTKNMNIVEFYTLVNE